MPQRWQRMGMELPPRSLEGITKKNSKLESRYEPALEKFPYINSTSINIDEDIVSSYDKLAYVIFMVI